MKAPLVKTLLVVTVTLFCWATASAASTSSPYKFRETAADSTLISGSFVDDGFVLKASGLAPNTPYEASCEYTQTATQAGYSAGEGGPFSNRKGKIAFVFPSDFLIGDDSPPGTIECWIRPNHTDFLDPPVTLTDGSSARIVGNVRKR